MFARTAIALVLGATMSSAGWAQESFPYKAAIQSDDVYVRSGPGKNYYPTARLAKGDIVEVYRHDPGGWYAIRPPRGSFSYVSARHVQLGDDGLGVVAGDRVVCRVGTQFSDVRDVIQVRLDRDEPLEILDEVRLIEDEQPHSYYKIAPPSGEFRWVFGKYVGPLGGAEPGEGQRLHSLVQHSAPIGPLSTDIEPEPVRTLRDDYGPYVRRRSAADAPSRPSPAAAGGWKNRGQAHAEPDSIAGDAAVQDPPGGRSLTRPGAPENGPDAATAEVDVFQAELNAIDLELSRMVAEEPSVWSFGALRKRCEAMLGRAETALERGHARLVLNRLGRFEDIQRRYATVHRLQLATDQANSQLAGASLSPPDVASVLNEPLRYDGLGKLTPVVSQRSDAPRYALVDDGNRVLSFVSPAPGVNLQPYVGRQVGITGQRGFMTELRKPHVTAARITPLEDVMRR